MVKAFHEAGIEVILDIVFNHTGEGDERGATFCWRGLDNPTYYLLEPKTGKYLNYSGCGNTLNCNHPVVRFQILAALRYWVTEMHVDGFRFDLASILGRGRDGEVLPNPPLIEAIAADPVMADVKLIAEAWDAAGLYQVGSFPSWGRWAEWNGRFRDELRRFVKSDAGLTRLLATRLGGQPRPLPRRGRARPGTRSTSSPATTASRSPTSSPTTTSTTGRTARATATATPRTSPGTAARRARRERPEVVALRAPPAAELPGAAVPVAGRADAARRATSSAAPSAATTTPTARTTRSPGSTGRSPSATPTSFRFTQRLVRFRKAHSVAAAADASSRTRRGPRWRGTAPGSARPDWTAEARVLAMHILPTALDEPIYVAANAHWEPKAFELPRLPAGKSWRRFLDTSLPPGDDALEPGARGAGRVRAELRGRAPLGRGAGRPLGSTPDGATGFIREFSVA